LEVHWFVRVVKRQAPFKPSTGDGSNDGLVVDIDLNPLDKVDGFLVGSSAAGILSLGVKFILPVAASVALEYLLDIAILIHYQIGQ
jgi:hypothetical protein